MRGRFRATWQEKKTVTFISLAQQITDIIGEDTQADPSLKTERCYVRLTASYIWRQLAILHGYGKSSLCIRTVNNILNHMGHTLKKVLKTKPLCKVPETDAIFGNVKSKHEQASANPRILRISIDVKAKVRIGNLSRGGYSRMLNAPVADDHDQEWDAVLVPLGIQDMCTGKVFLAFGNSAETSDLAVDGLEAWWEHNNFDPSDYDMLMIDSDNGQSFASRTRLFLKRITGFAKKIGMPIQMVYYPPYHSKYNPVERFWAALENYWSGIVLDTVENTLEVAERATYKSLHPVVHYIDKVYEKGLKVAKKEMDEILKYVVRNKDLPNWDVYIKNG